MTKSLSVGNALKLKITFTVAGVKTDPTTIQLEIKDPSGNVDTYLYSLSEITRESQGVYSKVITFDEHLWWSYEWEATGAVVFVGGNRLYIAPQLVQV